MSTATALLAALRAAGSNVFIDEDQLFCSPPVRQVDWDEDVEQAIDEWYCELKALVQNERVTIH